MSFSWKNIYLFKMEAKFQFNCMCACMYVYICMYICMCVYMYVGLCMYVCIYVLYVCMHVCMHVCMYVCIYVCVCVYVWCIYTCIYLYIKRRGIDYILYLEAKKCDNVRQGDIDWSLRHQHKTVTYQSLLMFVCLFFTVINCLLKTH